MGERLLLDRALLGWDPDRLVRWHTTFTGEILATGLMGGLPSVEVAITGRAWITGFKQYVLDPSDPWPSGYRLSDTWPSLGG